MDDKLIIASSLANNDLAKALSQLVAERWDNFDITPFMVYLVDTCEASVLPYLADQFDVTGLQGFEIAETESEKREIIKKSIALHKFIGTPYAIREACRSVGLPVVIIEEGVPSVPPNPTTDWANFRVIIQPETDKHITEEHTRKLRLFIEYYKNERSHLVEFGYYNSFEDELTIMNPVDTLYFDVLKLASYSGAYSRAYNKLRYKKAYSRAYSKDYNIDNQRKRRGYSPAYSNAYNNNNLN
jgi:phage tail P2-like protein